MILPENLGIRSIYGITHRRFYSDSDREIFRKAHAEANRLVSYANRIQIISEAEYEKHLLLAKKLTVKADELGEVLFEDEYHNAVMTLGRNSTIDVYFRAQTQITSWFVGLKGSGTIAAGDTAASKAWSEFANYSETTRQALNLAAASSGSATNSSSRAVFTINASSQTVNGAFLISNNTKSGTTGTLWSASDFASARSGLGSGDTLSITITVTAS